MSKTAQSNTAKQSLSSIDNRTLELAWKAIKENYKDNPVRDPLDLLAFEVNLDENLKQLAYIVRSGKYLPENVTTIRAAKRDGLTRLVTILEITDALVFKVIADLMATELHKGFSEQVAFGRSQQNTFGGDSQFWFTAWLNHQRNLKKVLLQSGWDYVVKSDISNFFASIDHKLLRQLIAERSGCSEDIVNLLFLLLESFTWRPKYRENLFVGLPQENSDASRILAHAFLRNVDEAFITEIEEGRYARWVDDIVIAVPDYEEGVAVAMRLQHALENRNLAINSGKTAIIDVSKFQESLYPQENAYLDSVMEATKTVTTTPTVSLNDFEDRLKKFLSIPIEKRLSTWDRILRRYYTCSRRIGSSHLEIHAFAHLQQFPSSAKSITRYLLQRPFQQDILCSTFEYLKSRLNVYQEVEIYLYDFLLAWCVPDDVTVCNAIADNVSDHLFGRNGWKQPLSEYTRGLMCLALYKFGEPRHIDQLATRLFANAVHDPIFTGYAVCTLVGTRHKLKALSTAEKIDDRNMRRIHSFLSSANSDPSSLDVLLRKYAKCDEYVLPAYHPFPARMLPIAALVHANSNYRPKWNQHLEQQMLLIKRDPIDMRDAVSLKHLHRLAISP